MKSRMSRYFALLCAIGLSSNVSAATITGESPLDLNPVSILKEAYESALQIESVPLRRDSLLSISEAQAEANDLTGALHSVSMLPPFSGVGLPTSKEGAIATIVAIRAEVGDLSGALDALTKIE